MPQIWMTYNELAALMNCDAATARAIASEMPLDRRKSHDGHTRAKLNAKLTEIFLDRLARQWIDREISTCVGELHAVHDRMTLRPAATLRERAQIAS